MKTVILTSGTEFEVSDKLANRIITALKADSSYGLETKDDRYFKYFWLNKDSVAAILDKEEVKAINDL